MIHKTHREIRLHTIRPAYPICLFLVMATVCVYWPVMDHLFINFDDTVYVTENQNVRSGLTLDSIMWSLTTTLPSNWHPLTWLSHMLDCQFYGMDPGGHHLTNLIFHIMNTLLLFLAFRRMTGGIWQSCFVAVLFAFHPLNVESVAWVSERKNVLSTFFWMLTLWGYVRYVECPGLRRYLQIILFFILGLMAKPMLVTLPFVLLLLDYWPLGRIRIGSKEWAAPNSPQRASVLDLLKEKIPLFVFSAAASIVTFLVQQSGGAVSSLEMVPLNTRIANALVSYVTYIRKMFWPHDLAILYPHPLVLPVWKTAGAFLLIGTLSVLVIRAARRHPYFAVGWFWYVGTLIPVIGLVQVGVQAIADRYTYVPLIGIFIIISWGVQTLTSSWRHKQITLSALAGSLMCILMAVTWNQVRYWSNSATVFKHALNVTANNYVAHNNLGLALAEQDRTDEAIEHYFKALGINPRFENAHINIGVAYFTLGRLDEALEHFSETLRINPRNIVAYSNLGAALVEQGKFDEAVNQCFRALQIESNDPKVHNNLGLALLRKGKIQESIPHFQEALRLDPGYSHAENNMKVAEAAREKIVADIAVLRQSVESDPGNADLHHHLGILYEQNGNLAAAEHHFRKAYELDPASLPNLNSLAMVCAMLRQYDRALNLLQQIIVHEPNLAEPYYKIAALYARKNQTSESIRWLQKAVDKGFEDWGLLSVDSNMETIRNSSYYKKLLSRRN